MGLKQCPIQYRIRVYGGRQEILPRLLFGDIQPGNITGAPAADKAVPEAG